MKTPAMIIGLLALAGTLLPSAIFMVQSIQAGAGAAPSMSHDMVKTIMLASTVAWFAAAPFWMKVE